MNVFGEIQNRSFQQNMLSLALIVAAAVCLLISILLAIADRVAAGSLTAALFVVCVLFYHLPQMESFQAFGVKAKWQVQIAKAAGAGATAEQSMERLTHQIEAGAPKETMLETAKMARTQQSTANNAVGEALTVLGAQNFSATTRSDLNWRE
jgi:hypothetical protein